MDRGHHVENRTQIQSQSQVAAITSNIARGRDVLAALAAAWSSSLDLNAVSEDHHPLHSTNESRPETTNALIAPRR